ncbi:hypothetical protein [Seleniivibrio sp.]|uniref:hypothetical protein n=1 Tax=Seleniivibrio sp. TaxID=2898801 RepID=UPI0025EEC520|nr:hypothetical protein [Seleniivibrio sp.]MCD8554284.1 hypothetical protein [Seleniivibrio sp.]
MKIGLDFDNTIVNYDNAFCRCAEEEGLLSGVQAAKKDDVKRLLIDSGREESWTRLQGLVYGARMEYAVLNKGFGDFISTAKELGAELFIVSHKTRYPYLGEKYDLHEAAWGYINKNIVSKGLVRKENIFFRLTKEEKIQKIAELKCSMFIDDLPDILTHKLFPKTTLPLLYGFSDYPVSNIIPCPDWATAAEILRKCTNG